VHAIEACGSGGIGIAQVVQVTVIASENFFDGEPVRGRQVGVDFQKIIVECPGSKTDSHHIVCLGHGINEKPRLKIKVVGD
jgi:hypothetical protein